MPEVSLGKPKLPSGKKSRASRPKTRSGCVTCKIRRVKCDEGKPHCTRCIKVGIKCDGYAAPPTKNSTTIRPVHPRIAPNFQPILWEPPNTLYSNENDYRYLQLFYDKTAHQLNGIVPTDLWSGLMLQACERNKAVRHGIIAIAALDIASQLTTKRALNASTTTSDPRTHYQFALREYSLAIRTMQKETSKGDLDLATTLITCLVIICFETFHGNNDNALSQINTGLLLIEQSVQSNNTPSTLVDGISSSLLSHLDESLIRAFVRLDLQAMSFVGNLTRGIPKPAFRKGSALTSLHGMPARFRHLIEARNYLELLLIQSMHFCSTGMEELPDGTLPFPRSSRPHVPASPAEHKGYYLAMLYRWHKPFERLLSLARTKGGQNDFLAATALELHYQAMVFSLETGPGDDMREFMPFFHSMLSLSKQILNHPDVKKETMLFAFDLEVVLPLYGVAWMCPHSETRREAVQLLLGSPRRECLWDGAVVGKIAEWVMIIEEEGLADDGYVPNERRMTGLQFEFDVWTRRASVSGLMPKKGEEGKVRVEAELTW